jgi:predicted RNA binding protein YcfA (HicA-like mRNA interferase family)
VKVSEIIRILQDDGWYLDRVKGSHRQYKHPRKPGLVTIAGKPSSDLAPGTLKSILKQAQIEERH